MGIVFNPFTGTFDYTGTGGGTAGPLKSVANIAALKATTGARGDLAYVVTVQGIYVFTDDVVAKQPDDDLITLTGTAGTTRWELLQKVSRKMGDTGLINPEVITLSKVGNMVGFNFSTELVYAIKGKRYSLASGAYNMFLDGPPGIIYMYLDAGGLKRQTTLWNFETQAPIALVYWDGFAIVARPQTEYHGIRDAVWHAYAHKFHGTQYVSGLVFTGAIQTDNTNNPANDSTTYLWSTTGVIQDEDAISTPGSGQWGQTLGSGLTNSTAGIFNFFTWNGTAIAAIDAMADRAPFIHSGGNTLPQWENGGVLTAATNGQYVVYHYFAAPMVEGWSVFARPHNAVFANLATAQTATPNSLTWTNYQELKHLYTAIWRCGIGFSNTTHRAKLVSLQSYRLSPGAPSSGISATDHQALSNRAAANVHPSSSISVVPSGNLLATDVESALIELQTDIDTRVTASELAAHVDDTTGAHAATAISTNTASFAGELSNAETDVQLALQRLDSFDSVMPWFAGKDYRIGNTVIVYTQGFEGIWVCNVAHTSAASFVLDFEYSLFASNWEYVSPLKSVRYVVSQAAHGFTTGQAVYITSNDTYALTNASNFATSECVGIVAGVTTNFFILHKEGILNNSGSYVAGQVYWEGVTDGAISVTAPSVVGQVLMPVGVALNPGTLDIKLGQPSIVGGTNLFTTIGLANNAATTIQSLTNFAANSAGKLEGSVTINDGTATRQNFAFTCYFAKNADNSVNVTDTVYAGTIPSGFAISNSGMNIQMTLPNVSGFVSASCTFAINGVYNGASVPLNIDSNNISNVNGLPGRTDGGIPGVGQIGHQVAANMSVLTATTSETDIPSALISLDIGTWIIYYSVNLQIVTGASNGDQTEAYIRMTDASVTKVGLSDRTMRVKAMGTGACSMIECLTFSEVRTVTSNGTVYKLRGAKRDNQGTGSVVSIGYNQSELNSTFYAVRIA
jgi:hypothetical protein